MDFLLLNSAREECWRLEFYVNQTNSCQKSQTSPPWRKEKRTTGRKWRSVIMTEDIKSLLQKNCNPATRYGFQTTRKMARSSRTMRLQDLSSSRPVMAVCSEEIDRWPRSCTSQQFLLMQWRTAASLMPVRASLNLDADLPADQRLPNAAAEPQHPVEVVKPLQTP